MLSYAKVIHEDPVRRGMLYLGTENAIYVTFDAGDTWQPLQNDLPAAPVSGIVVQEHFNDLVISTYGRGFYILDDITPLRAMTLEVLARRRPPVRAARRLPVPRHHRAVDALRRSRPSARTRPTAPAVNYYLRQAVPAGGTVAITNAGNEVVRTFPVPGGAGLNRVYWDLRYTPTKALRFRTDPMYGHELPLGEDDTRPAAGGNPQIADPGAAGRLYGEAHHRRARLHRSRSRSARTRTRAAPRPTSPRRRTLLTTLRDGLNSGVDAVN